MNKEIISCIDIGSYKISCVIAQCGNFGIDIIGYGYKISEGIKNGSISDIDLAVQSIKSAVADAELMSGINIKTIATNVPNKHSSSRIEKINYKIFSGAIKNSDIKNLIGKIRSDYKKNNQELIHLIPLEYLIDNNTQVINPVGMFSSNLMAKFHSICCSLSTVKNIQHCFEKSKLKVTNYFATSYASILSCLNEEEKKSCTLLIDIGGNNSSISLVKDNKVIYAGGHNLAGNTITKDISIMLDEKFEISESIKINNNSLIISSNEKNELAKYKTSAGINNVTSINKKELSNIISSRLEEILSMSKNKVIEDGHNFSKIKNVVLTGGCSMFIGIERMAESVFGTHTRVGYPVNITRIPQQLNYPTFVTILGMVLVESKGAKKRAMNNGFISKIKGFLNL
jgi:cell division protein FtsA